MAFASAAWITTGLLAAFVAAQTADIGLCTGDGCGYCPNSLLQQGTGYPACVVYDRDEVLGAYAKYYNTTHDITQIWYNIPMVTNPQCKTIIRTPADTDVKNCGYPLYGGEGGSCFEIDTAKTLMVQFCCGTGDCSKAGAKKRSGHSDASLSSMVIRHPAGGLIVPLSVGWEGEDLMDQFLYDLGINATSAVESIAGDGVRVFETFSGNTPKVVEDQIVKRDCDKYIPDGGDYTTTGSESYVVSGEICGSTSMTTIMNSNSVSHTTSFSASVSDPFGIVSTSVGFETETSATQSHQYVFTPEEYQCGHVAWTPYFTCTKGTITGCADGTQSGDVCTAKRISQDELDGIYHFVQTRNGDKL